jgi:hypothetical protein
MQPEIRYVYSSQRITKLAVLATLDKLAFTWERKQLQRCCLPNQ